MAKNPNVYKFEIIERIITEVDFTTKEEVLDSLFIRNRRKIITETVGFFPYAYGILIRLLRKLHKGLL